MRNVEREVYSGGQITSHNNNSEVIWMGGVTKYQGGTYIAPPTGPVYPSSATRVSPSGFISATMLPVQLTKFSALVQEDHVVIDGTTAEESEVGNFTKLRMEFMAGPCYGTEEY